MSDEDFKVRFLDPAEAEEMLATPNKVVGSWACRCGMIKWGPICGPAGMSMAAKCVYCGDSAEILPLPPEEGA